MYYTTRHEWIDYNGHNAFVGVCKNKLSGMRNIQSATFCDVSAHKEKGAIIATFYAGHTLIEVCMPVDGRIIDFNVKLLTNPALILSNDQESIWIVKISPNAPYKRDGLLQSHQYTALKKNNR